jgi:hypothetical protein
MGSFLTDLKSRNMKDLITKLKEIETIVELNVGKKLTEETATDNYDKPFFLVCSTIEMGKQITTNPNCIYVTPRSMDRLRGHRLPIIFDQQWLLELMKEYAKLSMFKEAYENKKSI